MGQRVRLAAQHHGGECGHAHCGLAAAVDAAQPGVLAADDAVQRHGGVPSLGRAKVIAQQADHGGLRGLFAHAAPAHAIGHSRDDAHALQPRLGHQRTAKIFVAVFGARLGGKADVEFKCHMHQG